MKIFLIENNIHLKKVVRDFTLKEPSANIVKIITVPLDINRLKRELNESVPNLLILNLDNYRSSYEELNEYLRLERFKYTSFVMTSKDEGEFGLVGVGGTFIKIHGYAEEDRSETVILSSVLVQKLITYNKIKSKIRMEVKKRELAVIDKSTSRAIDNVNRLANMESDKVYLSKSENLELDKVVPSYSSVISKRVIVIGSSIGGVECLDKIIRLLPSDKKIPPILITQHISGSFTKGLVERLNRIRPDYDVQIGTNKKILLPNNIYIAPGDKHMGMTRNGSQVVVEIYDEDILVSKHRPSIDVLFRAANNTIGVNALAIILTGMGKDGVKGMGELHASGAITLAQEKKSCVVQGIAGECIVKGFITKELSIEDIVRYISNF